MKHGKYYRREVAEIICKMKAAYPKLKIVDIRTNDSLNMRNAFMEGVQDECFKVMPAISFNMEDISLDAATSLDVCSYHAEDYLERRFKHYDHDNPVLFICEYGYMVSDVIDSLELKRAMILQVNNATCDYRDCDIVIGKGLTL